jgi:hypothetical protein
VPRRVVLVHGGHHPRVRGPPRDRARHGRVWRQRRVHRRGALVRGVQPAAAGRRGRSAARGEGRPRRPQLRRAEPRSGHGEVLGQGRRRSLHLGRHARRREAHGVRPRTGTPNASVVGFTRWTTLCFFGGLYPANHDNLDNRQFSQETGPDFLMDCTHGTSGDPQNPAETFLLGPQYLAQRLYQLSPPEASTYNGH